ncbi:hypothetical protein GCM10007359_05320 [Rothia aerolata]|uniref:Phosphatase n=1 Tax=Rothia aerolata TaxID=1812262 RepID=A0A917IMJ3_9MICC|nr:hypothetical protein GCM10007359_05320 [Rothia aerolata]
MSEKLTAGRRKFLPMLGHVNGKRSAVTCALKCNNACLAPDANCSDNHYFRDIVDAALTRRAALGLAAGAALVVGAGVQTQDAAQAAPGRAGKGNPNSWTKGKPSAFGFDAISPVAADVDDLVVPAGFEWEPIIRWGDPLFKSAPEFDPENQTARDQERQFGYNNDYLTIIPDADNPLHGILVCNHEYVNEQAMFSEAMFRDNRRELIRTAMMAQGLSVVELQRKKVGSPWTYIVGGKRNRRITTDTAFVIDGPAAGSDLMKTASDSTGTVVAGTNNNCSGGLTPWGTVLSGEENFDSYFVGKDDEKFARYSLSNEPTPHEWESVEPRWNANNPGYENESNRFGWIVELTRRIPRLPRASTPPWAASSTRAPTFTLIPLPATWLLTWAMTRALSTSTSSFPATATSRAIRSTT